MNKKNDAAVDPELDAELAEVEKMNDGFNDLDEDKDEEEQEAPEEDEEDDEDSPTGDDDEDEEDSEIDEEDEDTDSEEDESEEDESEDEEEDEDEEEEKPDDKKKVSRNRPDKYVPVGKYTGEKKQWGEDKKVLEGQIATMKAQLEKLTPDETNEAVIAYAEANDLDVDVVKGLFDTFKKATNYDELVDSVKEIKSQAEEQVDDDSFNEEWDEFLPAMQKDFPKASKAALRRANKHMEEVSHTRRYGKHPLGDIYKLKKKEFEDLLNTKSPKRGPVGSRRPGASKKDAVSLDIQKDEKTGQFDFSSLHAMEDGPKKEKAIEALSPEAYSDFIDDLDTEPMEVSRGGRKVKLEG